MPPLELAGRSGPLEALLEEPSDSRSVGTDGLVRAGRSDGLRAAAVLAHPHTEYGGTMHTKALYHAAKALLRIGCAVLRFNFRGAGRSAGRFSGGPGELDDFSVALDAMQSRYPAAPLWTGGMSFGAWVAMSAGAADPRVSTLIGISLPITGYELTSVQTSRKGKFFIHGERDELFPLKDVREFYARAAEPKELVVIDGADHLFDGKVGEVGDAIEDLLGDWRS
jgi:alpha/beta superfamily hydrolase